jgi:uncharacterized protein involved in outer membrane biogenesis
MTSSPRRIGKGWAVAAAVLGALVLGVVACEIAGWPFLAKPVERRLSSMLARDVQLGDEAARATVRFFGKLKVQVPHLQIGAPEWSQRPFFLQAKNAEMHLSYRDLWRAKEGAPLDIDLLRADRLDVHAERLADGRASWVFGGLQKPTEPKEGQANVFPTVGELRVNEGELSFVDVPLKADIVAKLALSEGAAAAAQPQGSQPLPVALRGLIASAEGTYGPAKLSANLRTTGVTPLLRSDGDAPSVPVVLELKANKASLSFNGTVTDLFKLSDLAGQFKVSGPSLSAAGDPLGVTLPTTGAFVLAGRVHKDGKLWKLDAEEATVGATKLKGSFTYDMRPRVPLLTGQVSSPRLLLADLAPTIGGEPGADTAPPKTATPPSARVLPDKEFDLPSLRAMNADVQMAFARVELGELFALPLQPLKTRLTLQDGKLRLNDLVASTADGSLRGEVALDGTRDVALWNADLRWSGVKLEQWLKQQRADGGPPFVSGKLVGRAQLAGQGRSTAQILGSLDGSVVTTVRQGQVSHLIVEAAGLDIAQALGVFVKGDKPLPVSCALADLKAEKGVLTTRTFVVDTPDSTVWAEGSVSMKDEALDLKATVAPKDFSPLALRTPLHVKGAFKAPKVSVEKAPLARRVAGAALLALVNPIAAVLPLLDKGENEEGDSCNALVARAREAAREGRSPADRKGK